MPTKIQVRRGTAAEWTATNPILASGEIGLETDTRFQKVGDGATAWNSLAYAVVKDVSSATILPTGAVTPRTAAALAGDAMGVRARTAFNESIRSLDLSAAHAEPAQSPSTSPVPYTGTALGHFDVVYYPQGWNGYRYWLAATPIVTGDVTIENPSVYCSQDGQTWIVPPGAANPVVPYPGSPKYNSDPDLVDGLDGRLYLFYRYDDNATSAIKVLHSSDGATWSAPVVTFSDLKSGDYVLSPSVVFDGVTWSMYYVEYNSREVRKKTSTSPFGPWVSQAITVPAAPGGQSYWHLNAVQAGGRAVLLLQAGTAGTTGGASDLYFAWADDGATFARASSPVLAHDQVTRAGGNWATSLYRAGFLFLHDGYETKIAIWYTGQNVSGGLFYPGYTEATCRRDPIASVLTQFSASDLSSVRALAQPTVAACFDNFLRPDSATGLGIAPTGHLWAANLGTLGISGGTAYAPAAVNSIATIDLGAADARVGLKIATFATDTELVFRFSSTSAYFRVSGTGTLGTDASYKIQRIDGSAVTIATGIARARNGDWVEVECIGSAISVYVNGRLAWSGTDTFNQTATRFGIQTGTVSPRYGGFFAYASATAAPVAWRPPVISSAAAPPTASADLRGVVWVTRGGAGVADTVAVCSKDAADAYAWRTLI